MGDAPAATRNRLLDTAERLFGERGFEATSLRSVTAAAGANVAAVNYHFGSKDGLLRAVVDRAMAPVNDERRRRLDALEADGRSPSVPELVRAFVEPGVDIAAAHAERGPAVVRFIGRVVSEPDARVRRLFAAEVDPVEGRFLAALRVALPALDDAAVRFAYASMLGLLALQQTGAFAAIDWPAVPGGRAGGDTERLVAFITAGILAV